MPHSKRYLGYGPSMSIAGQILTWLHHGYTYYVLKITPTHSRKNILNFKLSEKKLFNLRNLVSFPDTLKINNIKVALKY